MLSILFATLAIVAHWLVLQSVLVVLRVNNLLLEPLGIDIRVCALPPFLSVLGNGHQMVVQHRIISHKSG